MLQGRLGGYIGRLKGFLCRLGGRFGALSGRSGAISDASWAIFRRSLGALGPSRAVGKQCTNNCQNLSTT
eukprot:6801237-Pyramimonas_sp.AAC.1